jgi:hypothetical protein
MHLMNGTPFAHGGHQLIAYITGLVEFLGTSQLNSVFEKPISCKHFPSRHCKELVSVRIECCKVIF